MKQRLAFPSLHQEKVDHEDLQDRPADRRCRHCKGDSTGRVSAPTSSCEKGFLVEGVLSVFLPVVAYGSLLPFRRRVFYNGSILGGHFGRDTA